MSSVSAWILSIAGVICISVLLELIMPDGQLSKYIKNIFSFVIILVIILPLPKILNKEFQSPIFEYEDITLQDDYLYNVNMSKLSAITTSIENDLNEMGYEGVNIYISADLFAEKMEYNSVCVDLKNLVITEEAEHKNIVEIKEDAKIIVLKYIDDAEVHFEE